MKKDVFDQFVSIIQQDSTVSLFLKFSLTQLQAKVHSGANVIDYACIGNDDYITLYNVALKKGMNIDDIQTIADEVGVPFAPPAVAKKFAMQDVISSLKVFSPDALPPEAEKVLAAFERQDDVEGIKMLLTPEQWFGIITKAREVVDAGNIHVLPRSKVTAAHGWILSRLCDLEEVSLL